MSNETLGWLLVVSIIGLGLMCLVQYRMINEWRDSKAKEGRDK